MATGRGSAHSPPTKVAMVLSATQQLPGLESPGPSQPSRCPQGISCWINIIICFTPALQFSREENNFFFLI